MDRKKTLFLFIVSLLAISLILFGLTDTERPLPLSPRHRFDRLGQALAATHRKLSFDDMIGGNEKPFDIRADDVIVFLHIQKTGGTSFGRHLVRDLDLEKPCLCRRGRKKCRCVRPDSTANQWLFSRYSTGWKCGLHADYTELHACVDSALDSSEGRAGIKRRYFYITLLREPIARFISEFRHVQRGATWRASRHLCGGRAATHEELGACYSGVDWRDVRLEEFVGCEWNLALNRQTRMLADLSLVHCYNRTAMNARERDVLLLASAKENLRRMAFFGLCEYQKKSQTLFERVFGLQFLQSFVQLNETHVTSTLDSLDSRLLEEIRRRNGLDLELYEFARQLLFTRLSRNTSQSAIESLLSDYS